MKSPDELRLRLSKQWQNATKRRSRLLLAEDLPIILGIPKIKPSELLDDIAAVKSNLAAWRKVAQGRISWESKSFRDLGQPLEMPIKWQVSSVDEWLAATNDKTAIAQFEFYKELTSLLDPMFFEYSARRLPYLFEHYQHDIKQVYDLVMQLEPCIAEGKPLRGLSFAGSDSKFFERHRQIIVELLDVRFDGAASEQGLEDFLGAEPVRGRWLLVADLDGKLLPISQLRVRDIDLAELVGPAKHLIIIENEKCLYQLPLMTDTLAILGAGSNLNWLKATVFAEKNIAYWGDMDTWGLHMLSLAKSYQENIESILMMDDLFNSMEASNAVIEPKRSSDQAPEFLNDSEVSFYRLLLDKKKSRVEQEFVAEDIVQRECLSWLGSK